MRRLAAFVPRAGRDYAQGRNTDPGPGAVSPLSMLSPYLRRRMITEREVAAAVLTHHGARDASKYVGEVAWRTYWKGWLEMRPGVWTRYQAELDRVRGGFRGARDLRRAEAGETGIDGFDDWARQLVETGYLHNHARMWFASIWIFTLRLPWVLGADFFLRHLLDADPASNTLSWRWVAGLQTVGKTYLATPDNIARHTNGRYEPQGLATSAVALTEAEPVPKAAPLPSVVAHDPARPAMLLVTGEDLSPETMFEGGFAGALVTADLGYGDVLPHAFNAAAARDTAARMEARYGCPVQVADALDPAAVLAMAGKLGVDQVVTPYAPIGPVAAALDGVETALAPAGITLHRPRRTWDDRFWPHAAKGYFAFAQAIPKVLAEEGLG